MVDREMPISVNDLAKKLSIAPEAVMLHAMDLDFDIPEDEQVPDEIAREIEKIELGDEIAQTEHAFEEQLDREIIEQQQKRTAGQKKVPHKQKKEVKKVEPDEPQIAEDGSTILPEYMSVRELAAKIKKPIPLVIIKLKANGVVGGVKTEIDYETAAVVAADFDVKVKKESAELSGEQLFRGNLSDMLAAEDAEHQVSRPPVISVMGHVDHGKTSILDYIRSATVAEGEAGGITQRIGAYQVQRDGQTMTFLDTPGHEAFTVMRARGARATDIAILVVASTEGLMPQSIEAINHAKEAGIPIVVAINKMDLDGANPDLVKGQLAEHDVTPEDWGGDTPCIPVSAKTGQGIPELLAAVLVVSELLELKADPKRSAIATVLESSMDPKTGISATVLVNTGTLNRGDSFVIYDQSGRVRVMRDHTSTEVKVAPPSTPVRITGLGAMPRSGDLLQVMKNDKTARKKAEEVASLSHEDELSRRKKVSLAAIKAKLREAKMNQLKVILKADSQGTLEAVRSAVEKVKTEGSMARVVHSGVGEVSESDIMLATAGEAIVVGFSVKLPNRVGKVADQEGVEVLTYEIIYELTEKIEEILLGKEVASDTEKIIGQFKVKAVFAANKKMAVIGGDVVEGLVRKSSHFRVFRDGTDPETNEPAEVLVGHAKIDTVQQGQKVVNEMNEGTECGLKVDHSGFVFEVGDRLELFQQRR